MQKEDLLALFNAVSSGQCSAAAAADRLRLIMAPAEDLGHATVDHDRVRRCGFPEVIFAEGKTAEQVVQIAGSILKRSALVFITRTPQTTVTALQEVWPDLEHKPASRTVLIGTAPPPRPGAGSVMVVAAGTSDLPVAEEACHTIRAMGVGVELLADVGVAGLHRLLKHTAQLRQASAIVVVAGMEGALASVVGGLVSAPVIAVPSPVGYGAGAGGITPLLGMLNSCAANVAVVNIDNGVGAAVVASLING